MIWTTEAFSAEQDATAADSPAPASSWRDVFTPSVLWRIGIIAVLIGLLFRHELYRLTYIWTTDGTWSHGWLVPLFSLYFLYSSRERLLATRTNTNWLGLLVVLVALMMYLTAIWPLKMGYPKSLAIVLLIFGVVLWLCGRRIAWICLFPILYLLLALPLPERMYVSATMPLRIFATRVTTVVLEATVADLDAQPAGTIIEYLYRGKVGNLNVAEACSGMRSLMSLTALGVALAFLGNRPIWQRLILVASCVPIAVFCNVIRVYITSLLQVFGHADLAQGGAHMMLGMLAFLTASGLFVLESYVLSHLFIEEPDTPAAD